jgi:hypothetical protein
MEASGRLHAPTDLPARKEPDEPWIKGGMYPRAGLDAMDGNQTPAVQLVAIPTELSRFLHWPTQSKWIFCFLSILQRLNQCGYDSKTNRMKCLHDSFQLSLLVRFHSEQVYLHLTVKFLQFYVLSWRMVRHCQLSRYCNGLRFRRQTSDFRRGRRFFCTPQRPDRLRSPSILLCNGYRTLFPRW